MRNGVHTDAHASERPPDRTVHQLAQDYHHLLAQCRRLLRPVLEQLRAAPARFPEAVLGELLWPGLDPSERAAPGRPALKGFTAQEGRIAQLIAQGLSTEAIAAQLYIAPTTVKVHRRNIRKKLGLVGPRHRLHAYLARQKQTLAQGGHAPSLGV